VKRRDIFRVPARVKHIEGLGWTVILTFPGAEVNLHYGDEKPLITESPISLVLEYTVPDAQP
jgi:hypothetical protein